MGHANNEQQDSVSLARALGANHQFISRLVAAVVLLALIAIGIGFPLPGAVAQEGGDSSYAPGEVCVEPAEYVTGRLSVFHAYPNKQLTVLVDGQVVMSDASPGEASSLGSAEPEASFDVEVIDAETNTTLVTWQNLVVPDLRTLILFPGANNDLVLRFWEDPVAPLPNGKSRIQLRHAALGDTIDHRIEGSNGTSARGQATVRDVLSGPVDIDVSINEETLGGFGTVEAVEGQTHVYTIFNTTESDIEVVRESIVVPTGPVADQDGVCRLIEYCGGQVATVLLRLGQAPTDGDDVIVGTTGDDVIAAGDGDDLICGGDGADSIWGQDGSDSIWGEAGGDRLRGGKGDDFLYGGDGADSLGGGANDDFVDGEGGDDLVVRGNGGDDVVHGGPGNDVLVAGNGGEDAVYGGPGNDAKVTGGPRPDFVDGGTGDDTVKGNKGADTLTGGDGTDIIFGGPQPDTIDGGLGDDTCHGGTTISDLPTVETDTAVDCEDVLFVP